MSAPAAGETTLPFATAPEESATTSAQLQLGSGEEVALGGGDFDGLEERERELLTVGVRVGPEGWLDGEEEGDSVG